MASEIRADVVTAFPLLIVGIDHHHAPVALRERLAVADEALPVLLGELRALPGASEAAVLSTCNRVECYIAGSVPAAAVLTLLAQRQGIDPTELVIATTRTGAEGVRHAFRVASGLDSLVLGEDQILRQVKDAYELARKHGATAQHLNGLFQRALAVAKEVRTTTGIARHKLSVASVAVDLAKHVLGDLASAKVLVVGAGEIAELVLTYLKSAGVHQVTVVNRNRERAAALAERLGGEVADWSALGSALASHDVVVSSTAAPHPVIGAALVAAAVRRRRQPLVLIDLAVPRDIEPAAANQGDVYLYNIDDLERVVAGHREQRSAEVTAAEALIDTRLAEFLEERRPGRDSLLAAVAAWFDDVVAAEDARLAARLGEVAQRAGDAALRDDVRYGLRRVANKLQHRLLSRLRERGDPQTEAVVRELLGL